MGLEVTCPYCNHDQEEEWEGVPDEDENEITECGECEKSFTYSHYIIHGSDSEKSPCLNDEAEHDWKKTTRYPPIIAGKVAVWCTTCHEKKNIPADKDDWAKVKDKYDMEISGPKPPTVKGE